MLDEFARRVFELSFKFASRKASKSALLLDEFARRVFELGFKFASRKASKSALLLDEFARRAKSSLELGTLLDCVNAP
jgi:hypothetical protein